MPARVTRCEGSVPTASAVEASMRDEGLAPSRWTSGPGVQYGWHDHAYYKVLYCLSGSIVFHTRTEGDVPMAPGDRLDLDAGTPHAATVGPSGVACVEAPRR